MSLSCSYTPNYFSISDIIATEERISCQLEVPLPRLGFLDPSSNSDDLKVGTKLELPFWLAQSLHCRRRPVVSVEIPKFYKEGYREILEADASAVTLSKWSQHYYELGMLVRQFNHRDCERIIESLVLTFRSRIRLIMDWAQNPMPDPTLAGQLPVLERNLYLSGRKSRELLIAWLKQGGGNIETSETVTNLLRKRKRAEFESHD
ncbi:DNA replication complex GINS protein PSF3 [Diachasma alloeum]|uniref:DNA replication complex GINS protein PSF3 n=1 Tax=Diachasma alloeum TaxID=454923 RepID=UPI0007383EA7|nr:DNA replication complex GINS protein PSF3 [Diachasma alloeum]